MNINNSNNKKASTRMEKEKFPRRNYMGKKDLIHANVHLNMDMYIDNVDAAVTLTYKHRQIK